MILSLNSSSSQDFPPNSTQFRQYKIYSGHCEKRRRQRRRVSKSPLSIFTSFSEKTHQFRRSLNRDFWFSSQHLQVSVQSGESFDTRRHGPSLAAPKKEAQTPFFFESALSLSAKGGDLQIVKAEKISDMHWYTPSVYSKKWAKKAQSCSRDLKRASRPPKLLE